MADHNVARPDANWDAMMHDLDLIHDLMGGTAQMRRAGLKWLPREQAEHWDAWQVRLNRSILYNGLGRTIQAMAGHALTGDLILEGAAPSIRALCDNLDGRGMSLRQLAMRFIQLLLRDGTAHVLVDRPPEGGQPYAVIIEAAQVLGRVFDGSQHKLKQVRIRETAVKTVDRFRQGHHPQIRVLEEGVYEIWQQDSRQFWEVSDKGAMGLDDIPLVTASVGAPMQGWVRPPLMDLAWLNLAHWQSASDQRHILHIARVPILFARAMGGYDRPLEIGPNRLIMADDPAADIKFVEHSGAAIEAGRQDLIDLEDKMAVMGLELLTPRQHHPTATGRAIDQAHDRAMLGAVLGALKDSLNAILRLLAAWSDIPLSDAGRVILPPPPIAFEQKAREAELLLKARQSGDLEKTDFLQEIERRGIFSPHR